MRSAVVVVAVVAAAACATPRTLAPTPREVAHLRPASEPARVLLTYRVRYDDAGIIVRPGDRHQGDAASVPAWSASAAQYLSTSEAAQEALATPAVWNDRIVNDPRVNAGVPLGLAVIGAGLAVVAGGKAGDDVPADSLLGATPFGAGFARGAQAGAIGALAGGLAGIIVVAAVKPTVAEMAGPDYRRAVRLFNRDLAEATRAAANPGTLLDAGADADEAERVAAR